MRQKVVVVVPEGGSLFEIATPLRVWGPDPMEADWPRVDVVACDSGGVSGGVASGGVASGGGVSSVDLAVPPLSLAGLRPLAEHIGTADMVIVPTWPIDGRPVPPALVTHLRAAAARRTRIVGLCLGAYVLAEAGLLDGRTAVTHWRWAEDFAARFPAVTLDRAPLYIDHGDVVTSAGSAAALDCCLHLVRRDHGADAAATVARSLVTAPHRSGGQAQFARTRPLHRIDGQLGELLDGAVADIRRVRGVADLVAHTRISRRSLERHFRDRLGTTPRAWLTDQRVQAARELLEETRLSMEQIAEQVGFGSSQALRREFQLALRTAPTAYRQAFQPNGPTPAGSFAHRRPGGQAPDPARLGLDERSHLSPAPR
ncbi:MAG TPA: helix-turn-helix domain-containing protein [Pseudonocardia sp.]|nr:helix-turn-helix domain-containing protein [Pseudonocardia sp.]